MFPAGEGPVAVGLSGTIYDVGEGGRDELLRQHDRVITLFGGLPPALVAIASMLDVPGIAEAGLRPDVVKLLLAAADRLKSPPLAGGRRPVSGQSVQFFPGSGDDILGPRPLPALISAVRSDEMVDLLAFPTPGGQYRQYGSVSRRPVSPMQPSWAWLEGL